MFWQKTAAERAMELGVQLLTAAAAGFAVGSGAVLANRAWGGDVHTVHLKTTDSPAVAEDYGEARSRRRG